MIPDYKVAKDHLLQYRKTMKEYGTQESREAFIYYLCLRAVSKSVAIRWVNRFLRETTAEASS